MISLDLQNLLVCRNILKSKLVQELSEAVAAPEDLSLAHRFAGHLMESAEKEGWSGNLIRALFLHLLCLHPRFFTAEKQESIVLRHMI